jgi:hypothetical protein
MFKKVPSSSSDLACFGFVFLLEQWKQFKHDLQSHRFKTGYYMGINDG